MISDLAAAWTQGAVWLGHTVVSPVLNTLHIARYTERPEDIASALMVGFLQLLIIGVLFRPLESLIPAEKWPDRRLARIDFHYTWLMLIGLFPLFSFLILTPAINYLSDAGPQSTPGWSIREKFTWFNGHPWTLFILYYLCYDMVYYWMHRIQHLIPWWWAMHSMHHSQRQMSCWCNDRTSYPDGILQSFVLAGVGVFWGMTGEEFAWMMLLGELVQNFSHANVRIGFGPVLGRILVSPRFHRLHHMDFVPERPNLHNCNFGQVFVIWDLLFGTALLNEPQHPTGVSDPMVDRDNQLGLIALQAEALKRFWGCVSCRDGWRIGGVIFRKNYRPKHMNDSNQYRVRKPSPVLRQSKDDGKRV